MTGEKLCESQELFSPVKEGTSQKSLKPLTCWNPQSQAHMLFVLFVAAALQSVGLMCLPVKSLLCTLYSEPALKRCIVQVNILNTNELCLFKHQWKGKKNVHQFSQKGISATYFSHTESCTSKRLKCSYCRLIIISSFSVLIILPKCFVSQDSPTPPQVSMTWYKQPLCH